MNMIIRPNIFEMPPAEYFATTNAMRLLDWLKSADNDKLREVLVRIYRTYEHRWPVATGSSHNHQAWPGGLRDHLAEMCRNGWDFYQLKQGRYGTLPYTFDDILVGIFCHDAEKLIKGSDPEDPRFKRFHLLAANGMNWEDIKWEFLADWTFFGLTLTKEQSNAVKYTHGEPDSEYRKDYRVMWELAAAVGNLDRDSARGFHSHGRGMG